MKVKNTKNTKTLLTIALLFMVSIGFSQTPPPPAQLPPVGIPIDGGIALLIIAGVAYGIKKSNDVD